MRAHGGAFTRRKRPLPARRAALPSRNFHAASTASRPTHTRGVMACVGRHPAHGTCHITRTAGPPRTQRAPEPAFPHSAVLGAHGPGGCCSRSRRPTPETRQQPQRPGARRYTGRGPLAGYAGSQLHYVFLLQLPGACTNQRPFPPHQAVWSRRRKAAQREAAHQMPEKPGVVGGRRMA